MRVSIRLGVKRFIAHKSQAAIQRPHRISELEHPGALRVVLVGWRPIHPLEPGLPMQQIDPTHPLCLLYLRLRRLTSLLKIPLGRMHSGCVHPLLRCCQHKVGGIVNGFEYVDAADSCRSRDVDRPLRKLIAANDHVLQCRTRSGLVALNRCERTRRERVQEADVLNSPGDIEDNTRLRDLVAIW